MLDDIHSAFATLLRHPRITLQEVPIRNRTIAQLSQLLGRVSVVCALGHLPLALRINALVVEHKNEQGDDAGADEAELEGVSQDIARRVLSSVEVGCHG